MEAMQAQTMDVVKRMKEITLVMQTPEQELEAQGVTPAEIEGIRHSYLCKTIWKQKLHFLLIKLVTNL